jgi:hypothetical protein
MMIVRGDTRFRAPHSSPHRAALALLHVGVALKHLVCALPCRSHEQEDHRVAREPEPSQRAKHTRNCHVDPVM